MRVCETVHQKEFHKLSLYVDHILLIYEMTKNNIFLELKSLEIIQTEFLVWLNRLTLGKFLNALKCIIINPSILLFTKVRPYA